MGINCSNCKPTMYMGTKEERNYGVGLIFGPYSVMVNILE